MTKEVAVVGTNNQKFAVGYNVSDDKRSRRKKMITMKERQQTEKGGKGKYKQSCHSHIHSILTTGWAEGLFQLVLVWNT